MKYLKNLLGEYELFYAVILFQNTWKSPTSQWIHACRRLYCTCSYCTVGQDYIAHIFGNLNRNRILSLLFSVMIYVYDITQIWGDIQSESTSRSEAETSRFECISTKIWVISYISNDVISMAGGDYTGYMKSPAEITVYHLKNMQWWNDIRLWNEDIFRRLCTENLLVIYHTSPEHRWICIW